MVWMAPLFKFKDFGFFPKLMNLNPQQFDDSIIYISGYVSERSSSFVLGVFIFRSVNIPDHLPFSSNHLGVFPYEARWNMILCCKLTSWCWLFAPQIFVHDNGQFSVFGYSPFWHVCGVGHWDSPPRDVWLCPLFRVIHCSPGDSSTQKHPICWLPAVPGKAGVDHLKSDTFGRPVFKKMLILRL